MKLPSLVKLPRHKRFNFQPRYYDEVKEDVELRVKKIKQEMADDVLDTSAKRSPEIKFERLPKKGFVNIVLRLYLLVFMLFNLSILYYVNDFSNQGWGIILILQVLAVYLKIRFSKRN